MKDESWGHVTDRHVTGKDIALSQVAIFLSPLLIGRIDPLDSCHAWLLDYYGGTSHFQRNRSGSEIGVEANEIAIFDEF